MASLKKHRKQKDIDGIQVQELIKGGKETILGVTIDANFGPLVMFGLGGIFVEILKDVSFRIVPLTKKDAKEMIQQIKGYRLVEGFRGQAPVDIEYLEELLIKLSRFIEQNPEIKEMDINPLIAYEKEAVAVDARIILEDNAINHFNNRR